MTQAPPQQAKRSCLLSFLIHAEDGGVGGHEVNTDAGHMGDEGFKKQLHAEVVAHLTAHDQGGEPSNSCT